jgi:hypothetical protein
MLYTALWQYLYIAPCLELMVSGKVMNFTESYLYGDFSVIFQFPTSVRPGTIDKKQHSAPQSIPSRPLA